MICFMKEQIIYNYRQSRWIWKQSKNWHKQVWLGWLIYVYDIPLVKAKESKSSKQKAILWYKPWTLNICYRYLGFLTLFPRIYVKIVFRWKQKLSPNMYNVSPKKYVLIVFRFQSCSLGYSNLFSPTTYLKIKCYLT